MDGMRNLAIMKSMSWSISWQFLQRVFFIVGLATMPVMTGKFKFPIAGNHIGLLFFTAGILIWGIEMYCTRKSLTAGEKRGFLFLGLMFLWVLICTVAGVLFYPSFANMNLNQMVNFRNLYYNVIGIYPELTELDFVRGFLLYRGIRSTFASVLSTYFISLWIYHVYQKDWKMGVRDLQRALVGAGVFLICYSSIELGFLSGNYTCKTLLAIINNQIFDVASGNGWYPPLFWDFLQMRSLFLEPAHLCIFLIMAIPVLYLPSFETKTKSDLIFIAVSSIFLMMLFMTKSRTGAIAIGIEIIITSFWISFTQSKRFKKMIKLALCILALFLFSLGIMANFHSIDPKVNDRHDAVSAMNYLESNVTSVVGDKRSNSTRKINMLATGKTWLDHPIMGVGVDLHSEYVGEKFLPSDMGNKEAINWIKDMNKEGPIKSGVPNINHILNILVEQGLIGVILFLIPFGIVLMRCINNLCLINDAEFTSLLISLAGSVFVLLVSYDHIWLFIIVGLVFSALYARRDGNNI